MKGLAKGDEAVAGLECGGLAEEEATFADERFTATDQGAAVVHAPLANEGLTAEDLLLALAFQAIGPARHGAAVGVEAKLHLGLVLRAGAMLGGGEGGGRGGADERERDETEKFLGERHDNLARSGSSLAARRGRWSNPVLSTGGFNASGPRICTAEL